jgi:hypothetical protein
MVLNLSKEDEMSRFKTLLFTLLFMILSFSLWAQDPSMEGFNKRFKLVRNAQGQVSSIKLKQATVQFSVRPYILQLKQDILGLQNSLMGLNEQQLDELLIGAGIDPYAFMQEGQQEAQTVKEALLNLQNIDVNKAFMDLENQGFWSEFNRRLNEAVLFLDPTVVANLEDARFFYKRNVTHRVVVWGLEQAKKRFSNIPILNMASFIMVRVHDMMLEQRHFAHNMLLHYFETIPENKLGMTKEEVDKAISSIYEYRIDAAGLMESNNAARDWLNFGINKFYISVRSGNTTVRDWSNGFSALTFSQVKKLNWAFAEVMHENARKIYHLHHKAFLLSSRPSLAFDYSKPQRIKQLRALLNVGSSVLGFLPVPNMIKSAAQTFIQSVYVQQVRTEGALVGYFESTKNSKMVKSIYSQRSNLYIVE